MTGQYANHYIESLAKAQQRRGHIPDGAITTGHTGVKGFTETPIQEDPPQADRDQAAQICTLSPAQLRDVQAQVAEVMEIQEGTHFVGIRLPDGRRETAYCEYSDRLKIGDELFVTVRQRGRQRTIKLLGLVAPDRKEVTHE